MRRDHTETAWNPVVTDERDRIGDHVTTVIPTEYARVSNQPPALTRRGVESSGHVVTGLCPDENGVESSGHGCGPLTDPQTVACPQCAAAPGEPCRRTNRNPSKRIHGIRRDELSIQRMLAAGRPRIRWTGRAAGRALLAEAHGAPCPLCNEPIHQLLADLDHIIPFGIGGPDTLENLRVICRRCNQLRPRDGSDLA